VLGVETPKTLFPRGMLHSSVVAHILVQKFSLGVPHHRLEQHLADQGVELSRAPIVIGPVGAGKSTFAERLTHEWQAPDDDECEGRDVRFVRTDASGAAEC